MKIHDLLGGCNKNVLHNHPLILQERQESIVTALSKYRSQKDIYIHYAKIPKLGIYPGSADAYAVGIYCYPLKEIWNDVVKDTIPYAGDLPYVVVLRPNPNSRILNIGQYTRKQFTQDMDKLSEILGRDNITSISNHIPYESSGSCLWKIIEQSAANWAERGGPRVNMGLNKLFRMLGYVGVVDRIGSGTIHEVEPTQAVFFSSADLTLVEILPNNKKKPFIKLTGDESYSDLLKIVRKSPKTIVAIKNPPEKLMLAAFQKDPSVMQSFKNIPEKLQLMVVQKNGSAIQYIENPSEPVQLAAVQNNHWQSGYSIQYIQNPTELVKETSVIHNPHSFKFIKNPSRELQWRAIRSAGLNLEFVPNPTQEMQWAALKNNEMAIRFIANPTEDMKLYAVKHYPYSINYIANPTEEMIKIAGDDYQPGNKLS